jgi:hypothetical protein
MNPGQRMAGRVSRPGLLAAVTVNSSAPPALSVGR